MLKFNIRAITQCRLFKSHEQVLKAAPKALMTSLLATMLCCFFTHSAIGQCITMVCADQIVTLDENGEASLNAAQIANGTNSTCGTIANYSVVPATVTCADLTSPLMPPPPGSGMISATVTVTDNAFNSAICSVTITVQDGTGPNITCPPDYAVTCSSSPVTPTPGVSGTATAVDNCTTIASLTPSDAAGTGACVAVVRTWTALDQYGNTSSCVQNIKVEDTTAPVVTDWDASTTGIQGPPANTTIDCDAMVPMQLMLSDVIVDEDCGMVTMTVTDTDDRGSDPSNCSYYNYTITRTYIFEDPCGNQTAPHVQTITVEDIDEPTFGSLATTWPPITPNASCMGNINIDISSQLNDNCANNADLLVSYVLLNTVNGQTYQGSGTSINGDYPAGDYTLTFLATDPCTNTGNHEIAIEITDNAAPTASCITPSAPISISPTGIINLVAENFDGGSSDACPGALTFSIAPSTLDCGDVDMGPIPLTLTVTDASGNTNTCPTSVSVVDNSAPAMSCKPTITVQLDGSGSASIVPADVDNGSNDVCGLGAMMVSPNTFNCDDIGNNTVTLTVEDWKANPGTCTTNVVVEDNIDPMAVCTALTIDLNDDGMASVFDGGSVTVSGSGSVPVTIPDNNSAGATSTVEFANNMTVSNIIVYLTDIQHTNIGDLSATLTSPTGTVVNLFHRPGYSGSGSGCSNDDLTNVIFDDAEAGSFESPCTSTGNFRAMDPLNAFVGENAKGTWTLTIVDHRTGNTGSIEDWGLGIQNSILDDLALTNSTDNCDIDMWSVSPTMFDCADVGPVTYTLTVTDGSGNSDMATCTNMITIEDNVAPVVSCLDRTISVGPGTNGPITVYPQDFVSGGLFMASGNSGSGSASNNDFSIVMPNAMTITFDWDYESMDGTPANDPFGYFVNGTFTKLTDDNGPLAQSGSETLTLTNGATFGFRARTMNNMGGSAHTWVTNFSPGFVDGFVEGNWSPQNASSGKRFFYDACEPLSWTIDGNASASFMCADISSSPISVTIEVTDENTNSSSCTANITLVDKQPPLAKCKTFTVALDGGGSATVDAFEFDNGSEDGCCPTVDFKINKGTGAFMDQLTFGCSEVGINTIILEVDDRDCTSPADSNLAYCQTTLTVLDNLGPSITCPPDVTVSCVDGTHPDVTGYATATDNCTGVVVDWDVAPFATASVSSISDFQVAYMPSRWEFEQNGSTTSAYDFSGAPSTLGMTVNSSGANTSMLSVVIAAGGELSFDWENTTGNARRRRFGYSINGTNTQLTVNGGGSGNNLQSGSQTISVSEGDVFSFYVQSNTQSAPITSYLIDNFRIVFNNEDCQKITRKWTATDAATVPNITPCFQMITVQDNDGPDNTGVPSYPDPFDCDPPAAPTVSASDGNSCDASVYQDFWQRDSRFDYSVDPATNNFAPTTSGFYNYTVTRWWLSSDNCGNTDIDTRTVTVQDTTRPVINLPMNINVGTSTTNACAGLFELDLNTVISDNCADKDYLTVTYQIIGVHGSPVTGKNISETLSLANSPYTVEVTAKDPSGNMHSHTFMVHIVDDVPPTVSCLQNTIAEITLVNGSASISSTVLNQMTSSFDICGASTTVSPNTFDCADIANNPHEITFTATDGNGNSSSCMFEVSIKEGSAPTIVCPATIAVDCGDVDDLSITGEPTVTTTCPSSSLLTPHTDVEVAGTMMACYNIERTFTVDNGAGTDQCTQIIMVSDDEKPELSSEPADVTVTCGNVPTAATVTATDNCTAPQSVTYTESDNRSPDPADCAYTEYTITRTWSAVDDCTNDSTYVQTIEVENDAPAINIPGNLIEIETDNDVCSALVNIDLLDYVSDCTPDQYLTVTHNAPQGVDNIISGTYTPGDYTVMVTAVDPCGGASGTSTQTFTLRIKDMQKPEAQCFNSTVFLDNTGSGTLDVTEVDNGSDDNCGNVTLSFAAPPAAVVSELDFDNNDAANSPVQVMLHVTDDAGNTNTCTAQITVIGDVTFAVNPMNIGSNGQTVEIPVTVNLFEEITSFGAEFGFSDNAVGNFVGITNIHPSIAGGIVSPAFPANTASYNWFHAPAPGDPLGVTLPPDEVIFNLQVEVTGSVSDMTDIIINSLSAGQLIGGLPTPVTPVSMNGVLMVVDPSSTNLLSGSILERPDCGNNLVEQVDVAYDGISVDGTLANQPGTFSIAVPDGEDIIFTPSKNINYDNNVSSFDAVIALQYLANPNNVLGGLITLSPYQVIAIDANGDNILLPFDAGLIHQLANGFPVGGTASFPNSWRFVPVAETLNPFPFSAPFDESIELNNVMADVNSVDFYGIKVGDVVPDDGINCADAANFGPGDVTDDYTDDVKFVIQDRSVAAGEEVLLEFKAKGFAQMLSAQYTLNFDQSVLEYAEAVNGDLPNLNAYSFNPLYAEDGMVSSSWFNMTPIDREDGTVLFALKFVAKEDASSLSELLYISSDFIKVQAVKGNATFVDVDLEFEGFTTDTKEQLEGGFTLYQNTPNPFAGETTIRFSLPENTAATLTVTDASGRVLKVVEGNFAAGMNQVVFNRDELAAKGILFYRLDTPSNSAVRKMVLLD